MQKRIVGSCCVALVLGVGAFTACVGDSSTSSDTPDSGGGGVDGGGTADGTAAASSTSSFSERIISSAHGR